jgi:hypothetical protein
MTNVQPNFLIIGSQKAGTTSIYHILRQHPQIFMPVRKEINFFFLDAEYERGYQAYLAHFAPAPPEAAAIGEASPGYICHPLAPSRIHQRLPEVRLVLTVRNPIERAYSQYWDNRRSLSEYRTFDQVIETALEADYHPGRLGYFSRGTYIQYIERYLEFFPRQNLLVLPFDDLRQDAAGFYRRLFDFLGVDPEFTASGMDRSYNPAAVWKNPFFRWFLHHPGATRYLPARLRRLTFWGQQTRWRYPEMSPQARQKLMDFFRPWNARLAEFLGRDLSHWDQ